MCTSSRGVRLYLLSLLAVLLLPDPSPGAVLTNADFETGTIFGWTARSNQLTIAARTNDSFNRNYSAVISGRYVSANWITNSLSQTFRARKGDGVSVEGFVRWKAYTEQAAAATGYVRASLSGGWNTGQTTLAVTWMTNNNAWTYFSLSNLTFGPLNNGFESELANWSTGLDHLTAAAQTSNAYKSAKALIMSGSWTNWSWNQVYQVITCRSGETVQARAKMLAKKLQMGAGGEWLVAGIKLEPVNGGTGAESTLSSTGFPTNVWSDMAFSMTITNTTQYVFRCMVVGGNLAPSNSAEVYFDDVYLAATGVTTNITFDISYLAHSGAAGSTSTVEICLDAFTLCGSLADVPPATNILTILNTEARTIGTNSAAQIPPVVYPSLYAYGAPTNGTYPSYVEVAMPGWKFQYMTNLGVRTFTNTITLNADTNGAGHVEFDQFRFCAANLHVNRGQAAVVLTNGGAYFVLGSNDERSVEFGAGPFPSTHRYVQGTSLTNFPRRLTTDGSGGWPKTLEVVVTNFDFDQFDRSVYNLHFVLDAITTNGAGSNTKVAKLGVNAAKTAASNDVAWLSQDVHMGYATAAETRGLIDYANITYQDHNEVAVRTPWIYNLVDDGTGWFMQQSPRGSATIEPIELFAAKATNWVQRIYEEYLFTWPNAASGVRSIFDTDGDISLKGDASYHVGFKVGHAWGTNDLGQPNYPEVLNVRGNGYFRMADYDGVMAGSFRPVAADVFGLVKGVTAEDFPLIPKAYVQVVPRTTATNLADNSFGRAFMSFRSKTNQALIGTMQADLHFVPDEAATNGAWFDLSLNTWAHKAVNPTSDGPFALFAQVSMHWRGSTNINDATEGHDIDVVMVKRTNGEWVTHQVLNPPTNIQHRTLSAVKSNDVIYMMQQDRGENSYPFATEAPYRRASSFEVAILNDAGRGLNLDVYEQHTDSEINDNVDIVCNVTNSLTAGQSLVYKYRYRALYAPGVYLNAPNETGGNGNWSNDTYRLDFVATDGHDKSLTANLYYGNGLDANWTLINTNGVLTVPTNTHRVTFDWNTANVATGAYYIKATAQRAGGGKVGFDISNTRLQVSRTRGMPSNGIAQITVTTNLAYLGTNMGFETGTTAGWSTAADTLGIRATNSPVFEGTYAARMVQTGAWTGWGWNWIHQEVPCKSGELLHVTGKVHIKNLTETGIDWLACGIKMESTNAVGQTSSGVEFNQSSMTGTWLNVDFYRTAPVTGTDRLLLWCAGYDGTNIDVLFDGIEVVSTNGPIVTNAALPGFWVSTNDVDVTAHKALAFWVSGTNNSAGLRVWAKDAANATNVVVVTNHMNRIASVPQRVDIPWSAFTNINKAQLRGVGFYPASATNDVSVTRMRSHTPPLLVRSTFRTPPRTDVQGMPLYFSGETVTNIVTISNLTAVAFTNLNVQLLQEYGEDRYWLDASHEPPVYSATFRRGNRLGGPFEQLWTGRTVPANGTLTITNVYKLPAGKLITSTSAPSFYVDRNIQGRAQVHLVVRRTNGDNLYDNDAAGAYSMDDDTNQNNNVYRMAMSSGDGGAGSTTTVTSEHGSLVVVAGGSTRGAGAGDKAVKATQVFKTLRAQATPVRGGVTERLLFADNFNDGNYRGWTVASHPSIAWAVKDGALRASVTGKGGYAYATADKVDVRLREFTLEYDARFLEGAFEGGIVFRDRALYVSPGLCGWADANPAYWLGSPALTEGAWHHIVLDVREGKGGQVSDLYVDGTLIFADEPIESTTSPAGIGLLSPYQAGSVEWDNIEVRGR